MSLGTVWLMKMNFGHQHYAMHLPCQKMSMKSESNFSLISVNLFTHYSMIRSILVRLQSIDTFVLRYIYIGPPCPANCYGLGLCVWNQNRAICDCDTNKTSGKFFFFSLSLILEIYMTCFSSIKNQTVHRTNYFCPVFMRHLKI